MSSTPREANWLFVQTDGRPDGRLFFGLTTAIAAAAISFILWLVASLYAMQPGSLSSESSTAGWTTLALVGVLISVYVRVFAATRPSSASVISAPVTTTTTTDRFDQEIIWMLSQCVALNSLGIVAMLSPNLSSALPTVVMIVTAEICLIDWMPGRIRAHLGDLLKNALHSPEHVPNDVPENALPSVSSTELETAGSRFVQATPSLASGMPSQTISAGVTDEGLAYQEGVLTVELAAHQKSDSVAIAFVKAFACAPTLDLEIESSLAEHEQETDAQRPFDGEVDLDQVTPAGLRLTVKRHDADQRQSYQVRWYAIEDSQMHCNAGQLLASKLP